jgi:hypothetical protein
VVSCRRDPRRGIAWRAALALALHLGHASAAEEAVLRVGPQHALKTPSAAARVARDGDTIEIQAGTYAGDAAVWRQSRLTIRGVGGRAHLQADGASAEGKAIWVIKGADTTVEGISFSGARVPHGNGAGIRLEGPGLVVRNSSFQDNENGILAGANAQSDILIEHSEFGRNGFGDGQSHNLYVGTVRSFTLRYSYVHRAVIGHNVKSRARESYVTYNRIMDEHDGRGSYAIDLPDGGLSFVMGNLVQQGPANDNPASIAYGAEGYKNPRNELYVVSNTIVNDDPRGGRFFFIRAGADAVRIVNNVFAGPGELPAAAHVELRNNARIEKKDFVDAQSYDYRLRPGARAIGRGMNAGSAYGFLLRPSAEYRHPAQMRPRSTAGRLDLGALEFRR